MLTSTEKPAKRRRKLWLIVGVVVIVIAVIAGVVYAANRPGTAPPAPSGPNVTVWDTGFCSNTGNCGYSPVAKNVTGGTVLTWMNTGGQPHTVTECTSSDDTTSCPSGAGSNSSTGRTFDSNTQYSGGFRKDQAFSFTANLGAGTYYYYCTLHRWMHGAVIVGA